VVGEIPEHLANLQEREWLPSVLLGCGHEGVVEGVHHLVGSPVLAGSLDVAAPGGHDERTTRQGPAACQLLVHDREQEPGDAVGRVSADSGKRVPHVGVAETLQGERVYTSRSIPGTSGNVGIASCFQYARGSATMSGSRAASCT